MNVIPLVDASKKIVMADSITGKERDYTAFLKPDLGLLDLSYAELEERNLEVKVERLKGATSGSMREKFLKYLEEEKGIKAIMVCFSDLEGRFHTLDYDKKFALGAEDNFTFDGSSIKGFSAQAESDLRLKVDWTTFRWLPADFFGPGKILVFANVCDAEGGLYVSDFRASLYKLCRDLKAERGLTVNVAPEIEGFLFKGVKSEQNFDEKVGFELATMSGYFSSLPHDVLRLFIDRFAEVKRALAFQNEKDHPEVAPAQFELNYKYSAALDSADQIQLYKLLARQVANTMGLTASFLPKPFAGLNGSGMHMNVSISSGKVSENSPSAALSGNSDPRVRTESTLRSEFPCRLASGGFSETLDEGKNLFYDENGKNKLSDYAWRFITGVMYYASDLCLVMNSSVNSYRRLDPKYEAPNQIKVSSVDRGAMIRIPLGNEKSARIEVRTVAPDANPYLFTYALIKAGLKGIDANEKEFEEMKGVVSSLDGEKLPTDIYSAMEVFKKSEFMIEVMGELSFKKYLDLKMRVASRSPRALGNKIKSGEVLYHHEVTNQLIWGDF